MKVITVFNEYSGTLNKKSEAPFAEVHGGADAGPFSSHPAQRQHCVSTADPKFQNDFVLDGRRPVELTCMASCNGGSSVGLTNVRRCLL